VVRATIHPVPRYLVESFLPRAPQMLAAARARAAAAAELSGAVHVRTTCVPADETCFDVYDAASAGPVAAALETLGLTDARISEIEEG
jgi:hypothetical protein